MSFSHLKNDLTSRKKRYYTIIHLRFISCPSYPTFYCRLFSLKPHFSCTFWKIYEPHLWNFMKADASEAESFPYLSVWSDIWLKHTSWRIARISFGKRLGLSTKKKTCFPEVNHRGAFFGHSKLVASLALLAL